MQRIKNYLKKNNYIISFFLGSLCMYMILSYAGVLRTGKYCILEGDLFEIYVPVIRNFCRNIMSGQSIYYSWNNSLGMNTAVMLSFYGAYNPLNIFYLILYKLDPNIVTAAVVVIKAGLAALTFQLFEKKVLNIDGFKSIVFSIFYALCSFQVAYGIVNIIWTDALYVLPIVFVSLYILQSKGNPIPLTLAYAYIFIVQPYMGFVVGLFSFIYFVISIFLTERKVSLAKYILGFVISVAISILISSFAWLPALYQLINSGVHSSEGFESLGINPLDVYNQLFFGNNNSIVENMPNVYCGILSFLLLPIFFLDKKNETKMKIKAGLLLFILLISFVIPPVYKLWCAFDAPDGWAFRYSFCFSFVVVTIAAIESKYLKEVKKLWLLLVVVVDFLIYLLEIFLLKRINILFEINNLLFLTINIIILFIWIGLVYLLQKNEEEKKAMGISLLFVLLACFECIGNGLCSYYKGNNYYTVPETTETRYYPWYQNQKELIEFLKEDDSFYRVNFKGDYLYNSDTFSGYNGLSDFSTSENIAVRKTMEKLGFATSKKVIRNFGITPVTEMLFGVKYDVDSFPASIGSDDVPPLEIYNNPNILELGWMVDDRIINYSFPSSNVFENCNSLLTSMVGKDVNVYKYIDKDRISIKEEGMSFEYDDNGYIFKTGADNSLSLISPLNGSQESNSYVFFMEDFELGEDVYIYFDNYESFKSRNSMSIINGWENRGDNGGILSRSYIKPMDYYNDENGSFKFAAVSSNGVKEQIIRDYYIAQLDKDELSEIYSDLSAEQLIVENYSNSHIKGHIETKDDNKILFTTIPYDKGWIIKVDGNEVNSIPLLDNAFIGFRIPQGLHKVELNYEVEGLKNGIFMTIIGCFLVIVMALVGKSWKKDKLQNN